MRHTRPAVLALVVVAVLPLAAVTAAPAAGTSGGGESTTALQVVREVPNTTNHVDIEADAVQRGDHADVSLDVGGALELAAVQLRADYNQRAFGAAYAGADSEAERVRRLRVAVDRLALRAEQLERRQQSAIDRYNAGDITAETLLVELAAVDAAADGVVAQFGHLRRNAGFSLPETVDRRMTVLEADLVAFRGPVRNRANTAIAGRQPATTAYALTSTDAVVLSTTGRTQFLRETTLPGNRAPDEPNQFTTAEDPSGITAANERAIELYPWAYADAGPSIQRLGSTAIYSVTLDHSQGQLDTFLDGATRSVFHERQTLRVERLPVQSRSTNTTADLELAVNRTYGTGPMAVRVLDASTGDPVDATVRVNGHRVGATGDDGTLWTVTPHRQVIVEAATADHTVRVTFFAN